MLLLYYLPILSNPIIPIVVWEGTVVPYLQGPFGLYICKDSTFTSSLAFKYRCLIDLSTQVMIFFSLDPTNPCNLGGLPWNVSYCFSQFSSCIPLSPPSLFLPPAPLVIYPGVKGEGLILFLLEGRITPCWVSSYKWMSALHRAIVLPVQHQRLPLQSSATLPHIHSKKNYSGLWHYNSEQGQKHNQTDWGGSTQIWPVRASEKDISEEAKMYDIKGSKSSSVWLQSVWLWEEARWDKCKR